MCRAVGRTAARGAVSSDPAPFFVVTMTATAIGVYAVPVLLWQCPSAPLPTPPSLAHRDGFCTASGPLDASGVYLHSAEFLQNRSFDQLLTSAAWQQGVEQNQVFVLFLGFNSCAGLHSVSGHLGFLTYSTTALDSSL